MGGILPGLMMAALLSATVIIQVLMKPEIAPRITQRVSFAERVSTSAQAIPTILIAVMIIVSLYVGLATPSDTGPFGAPAALLVAFVMFRFRGGGIHQALPKTAPTQGMLLPSTAASLFTSRDPPRLAAPA